MLQSGRGRMEKEEKKGGFKVGKKDSRKQSGTRMGEGERRGKRRQGDPQEQGCGGKEELVSWGGEGAGG